MNTPASNMFELRKGECRKKKRKKFKKKTRPTYTFCSEIQKNVDIMPQH